MVTNPASTTLDWELQQGGSPINPTSVVLIAGTYHLRNALFGGAEDGLRYVRGLTALRDDLNRILQNFGPVPLPF